VKKMSAAVDFSGQKDITKNTDIEAKVQQVKKTYITDLSFLDSLPTVKKPKKKSVLEEHLSFLESLHRMQSSQEIVTEKKVVVEKAEPDPVVVRFESVSELLGDAVDQATQISTPEELVADIPDTVEPVTDAREKKMSRKLKKKNAAQLQREERDRIEKERAAEKKAEEELRHQEAREREERLAREAEEARNKRTAKKSLFGKLVAG